LAFALALEEIMLFNDYRESSGGLVFALKKNNRVKLSGTC
jgi:hypothetical protein